MIAGCLPGATGSNNSKEISLVSLLNDPVDCLTAALAEDTGEVATGAIGPVGVAGAPWPSTDTAGPAIRKQSVATEKRRFMMSSLCPRRFSYRRLTMPEGFSRIK